MNKTLFLGLFVALLMVFSVSASFTVSPASVAITGDFSNTVDFTVTLTNSGTSDYTYTATEGNYVGATTIPYSAITTVSAVPASSTIAAGTSVVRTYTVDLNQMYEAGDYLATFSYDFNESNGTGTTDVPVTLTVPVVYDFDFASSTASLDVVPGDDFSKTFTISNTGSADLSNFVITLTQDPTSNDLSLTNTSLADINFGNSGTFTVSGTMPSDVSSGQSFNVSVKVDANGQTKTAVLTLNAVSMLQFTDLTYDVKYPRKEDPNDKDGDLTDGETITVGEGAKVIIDGDILNLFTSDVTINNVEVFINIRKMDNGNTLKDYDNINDLDYGDSDGFKFEFNVPYDELSKGDTVLGKLWVTGIDTNNIKHRTEIEFTLRLEQDSEEVTIMDAYLSNAEVSCDRNTVLYVKLKNTGKNVIDESNSVTLIVKNSKLGLNEVIQGIKMDNDEYDSTNEQIFPFELDTSDISSSSIPFLISIEAFTNEDKNSDETSVYLTVKDCTTTTTVPVVTTTVARPTTTTQKVNPQLPSGQEVGPGYAQFPAEVKDTNKTSFTNSEAYIILLIGIFVVLAVIAIALVVYLVRKK